jgi:ureidoacrylate peracid hydrolase
MNAERITPGLPAHSMASPVTLPARPEPLGFVPSESALVIVDVQNAYASPGGYLDKAGFDISGAAPAIAQINKAITAARASGMQVVFFQNGWDKDYQQAGGPGSPNYHKSNALKTMRRDPSLEGTLLARGGWDYELVDALKPEPQDIIIHKTRYSAFFNTNLDSMLRARGIRTLVFTGIATNVCVESTLRDAFHLEYFSVVLADGTHHAGPDYIQQASLFNIETFFGWVSTVPDFCGTLGQYEGASA